jgi:citrate lyase subunit beta/citryl-CoA lyase
LPADVLVLDLEDSVPAGEKVAARAAVAAAASELAMTGAVVFVRVNAASTGLQEDDLRAVVVPGVAGISMSKPERAEDVRRMDALLTELEGTRGLPEGGLRLVVWAELPLGVLNAYEIAAASPRVVALSFGGEDFLTEMGIRRTGDAREFAHARAQIAIAARAAGVLAIDTPDANFGDLDAFEADARRARGLGFLAKYCIHPNQLEVVNRVFAPSPEEVAEAKRILAAYAEGARLGLGAVALDGRMIDAPVVLRAERLLARAGLTVP